MKLDEMRRTTTPRTMAVGLATTLAAFVLSVAAPARAADDDAAARSADLKAQGDVAMEAGNYSEALADYKNAYTLAPDPALLYNTGRAQERLGMYPEALRDVAQFARTASPELRARVPHLAELLAELRAHVALVTVRCNVDGARVMLRGHYVASTPTKWAIATTPGKATVEIQADGYAPWDRSLALDEGKTTPVDATLLAKGRPSLVAAQPQPKPKPTSASSGPLGGPPDRDTAVKTKSDAVTSKWWFWTGIGVGVMGGVALTAALLTQRSAPSGDLGQASAPLVRW